MGACSLRSTMVNAPFTPRLYCTLRFRKLRNSRKNIQARDLRNRLKLVLNLTGERLFRD
jgi:hypothetical protein